MDLSLNDTQQLIQDSARDFVRGACARDVLLKLDRDPAAIMDGMWKQMSELGWTGMAIPEQYGGTGNCMTDVDCCSGAGVCRNGKCVIIINAKPAEPKSAKSIK